MALAAISGVCNYNRFWSRSVSSFRSWQSSVFRSLWVFTEVTRNLNLVLEDKVSMSIGDPVSIFTGSRIFKWRILKIVVHFLNDNGGLASGSSLLGEHRCSEIFSEWSKNAVVV
mgnify:CR=1 FL=1